MKQDRTTEILNLATNLELMLNNDEQKFVAFTTDNAKFDIMPIVSEVASVYKASGKKVAVACYDADAPKIDGITGITIDANEDTKESIYEKTADFDIVIVICPSMVTSKSYLHMATYLKDVVVIAKKWQSKTANIKTIKELAELKELNILGIVYQH